MKKLLFLILAVCLVLSGCGKSNAVKLVEDQISELGTITADSGDALQAARQAYDALDEKERAQVENAQALTDAENEYGKIGVVGKWYAKCIFWNTELSYGEPTVILNADGSAVVYGNNTNWTYADGKIQTPYGNLVVTQQDGSKALRFEGSAFGNVPMPMLCIEEEYKEFVDQNMLVIDLAQVNPDDVFELYIQDVEELDEWEEATGDRETCLMLGSKLYDQGWYYLWGSDATVEVLIPAHQATCSYSNGQTYTYDVEEEKENGDGFYWPVAHLGGVEIYGDMTSVTTTDLTADQIHITRAKGKLVFVNKDYVTDITWKDQYTRTLTTKDSLNPELEIPASKQYWNEEHPY